MINKKTRIHRGSFKMIKRANQKKKKGFSLIELIIVLAVMAIIALIAIPNFAAVRESSKIKADTQSGEAISRSIETLLADDSIALTGTNTTGTITFNMATVPVTVDNITLDKVSKGSTSVFADDAVIKANLAAVLANTSKPQENGKTKFQTTITKSGTGINTTYKVVTATIQ